MTGVVSKIINQHKLVAALADAFENWAQEDIDKDHWDYQFKNMSRWDDWPGETRRKNGELVDSPRDIYDLGDLHKSKEYTFSRTSAKAEAGWHWGAVNSSGQEYAFYVHYGTRKMKDRPFTDDIAIASSFLEKAPGMALVRRMQASVNSLHAN